MEVKRPTRLIDEEDKGIPMGPVKSMVPPKQQSDTSSKAGHSRTPSSEPPVPPMRKKRAASVEKSKPSSTGVGKKSSSVIDSRSCPEHTFLTDVADVRQMEQGLLRLLEDFHSGHLQAFEEDIMFSKMDQVREQQERLARLHFELDGQQEVQGLQSPEARESSNRNLEKLMDNLHTLCGGIQNLQKDHH